MNGDCLAVKIHTLAALRQVSIEPFLKGKGGRATQATLRNILPLALQDYAAQTHATKARNTYVHDNSTMFGQVGRSCQSSVGLTEQLSRRKNTQARRSAPASRLGHFQRKRSRASQMTFQDMILALQPSETKLHNKKHANLKRVNKAKVAQFSNVHAQ